MLFEARTIRRSGPIDAASRPSADGRELAAHAQHVELDRVPDQCRKRVNRGYGARVKT
jgi:hypothetical protein